MAEPCRRHRYLISQLRQIQLRELDLSSWASQYSPPPAPGPGGRGLHLQPRRQPGLRLRIRGTLSGQGARRPSRHWHGRDLSSVHHAWPADRAMGGCRSVAHGLHHIRSRCPRRSPRHRGSRVHVWRLVDHCSSLWPHSGLSGDEGGPEGRIARRRHADARRRGHRERSSSELLRRDELGGLRESDPGHPREIAARRARQAMQSAARPQHIIGHVERTGFRAAAVSSKREMRVLCGASRTNFGSSSTSSAIDFMASMKRSNSSFGSLSVGSIISAPGTISGNAVVYG